LATISPGPCNSFSKAASLGVPTSMNAKRRMSAYDMSNNRFLSNTFIVAMIRQFAGTRMTSVFSGGSTPGGTIEIGLG
jgi:hypothetical protein